MNNLAEKNLISHISYLIFILLLSLFLTACSNDVVSNNDKTTSYFSLKDFFEEEIEGLEKRQQSIEKTAFLNDKSETKTLEKVDWAQELRLFTNCDINKSAWLGKYKVDSLLNDAEKSLTVSYTALDDKLRTRHITLTFVENVLTVIDIKNNSQNLIYNMVEELLYKPKEGYEVETTQKIRGMNADKWAMKVRFR